MSKIIGASFVMISADIQGGEDNTTRREALERDLRDADLAYKRCLGIYQGGEEISFCVFEPTSRLGMAFFYPYMEELAHRYEQDSWLEVDANRHAILRFTAIPGERGEDQWVDLGIWKSDTLRMEGDCTVDLETGVRYACFV